MVTLAAALVMSTIPFVPVKLFRLLAPLLFQVLLLSVRLKSPLVLAPVQLLPFVKVALPAALVLPFHLLLLAVRLRPAPLLSPLQLLSVRLTVALAPLLAPVQVEALPNVMFAFAPPFA